MALVRLQLDRRMLQQAVEEVFLATRDDGMSSPFLDGAGETIEGKLAADLTEQDVGIGHGHVVARRRDNAPMAPDAHAGAVRSLGNRTRL